MPYRTSYLVFLKLPQQPGYPGSEMGHGVDAVRQRGTRRPRRPRSGRCGAKTRAQRPVDPSDLGDAVRQRGTRRPRRPRSGRCGAMTGRSGPCILLTSGPIGTASLSKGHTTALADGFDRQHGASSIQQHPLGVAAEQQLADRGAAAQPDHDELGIAWSAAAISSSAGSRLSGGGRSRTAPPRRRARSPGRPARSP